MGQSDFQKLSVDLPSSKVEILVPKWPAPDSVKAFFTLRKGGQSHGKYNASNEEGGLNLGTHVGDNLEDVLANRKLVMQLGCQDIRWLNQIHSTTVLNAKDIKKVPPDADASWTENPNIGCVVMTADCLPVLLCTSDGTVVAAAHAGWKGLVDGVLQETVKKIKSQCFTNSQILAWLGPRIGEKNFVVQEDVVNRYRNSSLKEGVEENIAPCSKGFLLNMAGFAKLALRQTGVEAVYDCGLSTYEDESLFYSYRRDGITGRHAAIIYKNA